jgi:hypothetical protein
MVTGSPFPQGSTPQYSHRGVITHPLYGPAAAGRDDAALASEQASTTTYDVVMPSPTSVRFDQPVSDRLTSYVARHPGSSRSSVAARYVDEGLRMDEHPGILFRDGPAGRRATLVGGPDVWEIVRTVKAARAAEPELPEPELLAMLEDNAGITQRMIRIALGYWGAYPQEVDTLVRYAEQAEAEHLAAAARARALLAR